MQPRWATFLRNHAKGIIACDFLAAVTVTFRLIYVFVVNRRGSRRLLHLNVTTYPTAAWTLQQVRQTIGFDDVFRFYCTIEIPSSSKASIKRRMPTRCLKSVEK